MSDNLSRRNLISGVGFALGGAMALKALPGCSSEDGDKADTGTGPAATTGPQVKEYPYESFIKAGYKLDTAAVKEAAYQLYYAGGCCHGSYRALLEHLATTVGAPFDLLPLDFGKFGAGGIGGYGSICGSLLGGVMIINHIVIDPDARSAMMTDLLRWYEGNPFPAFVPKAIAEAEKDLTKDFSAANIASLQLAPKSHLCHASVSAWCAANGVSAGGSDKKARCARLTADVAGKAAEIINAYLAARAYKAADPDAVTATCVGCHTPKTTTKSVASGMSCNNGCHSSKLSGHP